MSKLSRACPGELCSDVKIAPVSYVKIVIIADLQQRLTREREEACDFQAVIEVLRQELCNRHEFMGEKEAKLQHLAGVCAELNKLAGAAALKAGCIERDKAQAV